MAEATFTMGAVPNRYQDVVQRIAVLYPLRGRTANDEGVRIKTAELVEQWRARIGALTAFGFLQDVNQRYSIMYARNCLPTFSMALPRTRPCSNMQICPFCYARRVRSIWEQLDGCCEAPEDDEPEDTELRRRILLPTTQPIQRRSRTYMYQLLERHHTFFRPVHDEDNPTLSIESNLAGLLTSIIDSRKRIVELVNPLGAFCFTSVEPYNNGTQWKIRHRQLFKTMVGYELPPEIVESTKGGVTYHVSPTRMTVMRITARICAYPKALITGDPERVAQLMRVRRLMRFRSYAGFRGFRGNGN